jgi:hypothetical protein
MSVRENIASGAFSLAACVVVPCVARSLWVLPFVQVRCRPRCQTARWSTRRSSRRRRSSSASCAAAGRPTSARAAPFYPVDRSSASPSHARSFDGRACSCWTKPRPRSTPRGVCVLRRFMCTQCGGGGCGCGCGGGGCGGGGAAAAAFARSLTHVRRLLPSDAIPTPSVPHQLPPLVSERVVQTAIEGLVQRGRAEGSTTIMIAHRLSTVANVDRVIVMRRGRIIEMGSPQELQHQGVNHNPLPLRCSTFLFTCVCVCVCVCVVFVTVIVCSVCSRQCLPRDGGEAATHTRRPCR